MPNVWLSLIPMVVVIVLLNVPGINWMLFML